jgi:pimeloyl-ACP methyl ester carboxylesterase
VESLAHDLLDLATSLGPCHVVGHSLGGMVAMRLALDAPRSVRSLSVINSTAYSGTPWLQRMAQRAFIRGPGMTAFAWVNARGHLPGRGQEALRARFMETMAACPAQTYLAIQDAVDGCDMRARLGEIACPVLVVHSEGDLVPRRDKEQVATGVRDGRLVTLASSRHIAPWDQPDRLNEVLLGFLDQVGHPTAGGRGAGAVSPGGTAR